MGYLPIFVDVSGRHCVVIGGGDVAERKTRSLIGAGAVVTVVSPELTPGLSAMADAGAIRHLSRRYLPGDLAGDLAGGLAGEPKGVFLAFAATGEIETERAAAVEARACGVLINVADVPELCSFIAPAVVQRGGLQIAVSTGGASPALARKIREDLEDRFGPEYALIIDLLAASRQWLKMREGDVNARARVLTSLMSSDLRECIERHDLAAADATIRRVIGASFSELGFDRAQCDAVLAAASSEPDSRAHEAS